MLFLLLIFCLLSWKNLLLVVLNESGHFSLLLVVHGVFPGASRKRSKNSFSFLEGSLGLAGRNSAVSDRILFFLAN